MKRHPLSGYPLEHEHVIELRHLRGGAARAACSCGQLFGHRRLELVEAWIVGHRRRHHPRFRA